MPGKNNGTGRPLSFQCWACRRRKGPVRWPLHRWAKNQTAGLMGRVKLTGRTRPAGGNQGCRNSSLSREYVCQDCGHVGWSRHTDLEVIERRTKKAS